MNFVKRTRNSNNNKIHERLEEFKKPTSLPRKSIVYKFGMEIKLKNKDYLHLFFFDEEGAMEILIRMSEAKKAGDDNILISDDRPRTTMVIFENVAYIFIGKANISVDEV